ncbi:MAG: hypothetical protein LV479_01490 [Methylacidiphilales bacterium]|nr:hypothetical protein [Candidatus Methylacidiphilales bacterium]
MSDETKPSQPIIPSEIDVHFIKGTQFRVAQANGAWFGSDPQGNFHLTFYSERIPLPTKITVKLNEKGQFVAEDFAKRESKLGIVREMEIDIVMSVAAAQGLYQLLGQNLEAAMTAINATSKAEASS